MSNLRGLGGSTEVTFLFFSKALLFLVLGGIGSLFSYLALKGFMSMSEFGLHNIFLTLSFQPSTGVVSFIGPLLVSLILVVATTGLAIPISIRAAIWLQFRVKGFKGIWVVLGVLSGIPSVVFGAYARSYLGLFFGTPFNLLSACLTLFLMVTPLLILSFRDVVEKVKREYIFLGESLGLRKSFALYKMMPDCFATAVRSAVVLVTIRVLSESASMAFLLSDTNYANGFSKPESLMWSNLSPLTPLITGWFLSEGSKDGLREAFIGFAVLLSLLILIFQSFFKVMKLPRIKRIKKFSYLQYKDSVSRSREFRMREIFRLMFEYFSTTLVLFLGASLLSSILWNGVGSFNGGLFSFGPGDLGRTTCNTLIITLQSVFLSLLVSVPISIYLTEFCEENLRGKFLRVIRTFGSSPPVLYGILGFTVFIGVFCLGSSGSSGGSMLAAILTLATIMSFRLIDSFTFAFLSIPQGFRANSISLGTSRLYTFFKVVWPTCAGKIFSSVTNTMMRICGANLPLVMTAGLVSSNTVHLLNPAQTLTTRIISALSDNDVIRSQNIIFETSMIIVFFAYGLNMLSGLFELVLVGKVERWSWVREAWVKLFGLRRRV